MMQDSRGILNMRAGEKRFRLARHSPSEHLTFFVDLYWIVSWDLRGQEPYIQETLPYPCVHLVFEREKSRVYGVETGRFTRQLEGQGQVFGIKFRPGAFYPFVKVPVSRFTDTSINFQDIFGMADRNLEQAIFACEDEGEMKAIVEDFLRGRLPERDENVREINRIIDHIIEHQEITRVDDMVEQLQLNKRGLQRLFSQYVGVSPKWVIKRYRLHEAAERVAAGNVVDWTALALDLGYFDQAHFIKDFKALVGRTPGEYARAVSESL